MKVVVATCDKYYWLTPIFLHFYRKNWPDNPYQTEFVTETLPVRCVDTLCAGKLPWADRMIKYLESYREETFLFIVEDYIFNKPINTNIIKSVENLHINDVGCFRLSAHNPLSRFLCDGGIEGFKEYPLDKPYSVSLQASIWQKSFFLEFLRKGESVWQTETEGSKRVHLSKKRVMWADTPAFSYVPHGYMQKGVVDEIVEQWVKENW